MSIVNKSVVILFQQPADTEMLSRVAGLFGWNVLRLSRVQDLRRMNPGRIAAVIIDGDTAGRCWLETVEGVREAAPGARLIAAHRFSEPVDSASLAEAGVFHALRLPLSESELFQSLGYVWSHEQRAPAAVETGRARNMHAA